MPHAATVTRMARLALIAAALVVIVPPVVRAEFGSAISYQGVLRDAGQPVENPVTLTFQLYEDCTTPIGPALVRVVDPDAGQFTVDDLNFGVAPFAAQTDLCIELAVNGVILSPRQPIRATPFSLATRGINVATNGVVTVEQPMGVGVNTPTNTLSVAGTLNVDHFSQNDGTHLPGLRFGPTSAETIASKRTAGGNQFGLDFYTSGVNRMAVTNQGLVGIGTVDPQASLHIDRQGTAPGGTLALEGDTHTYLSFFPNGFGAGRKGWLGFGSPSTTTLTLQNDLEFGDINLGCDRVNVGADGGTTRIILDGTALDGAGELQVLDQNGGFAIGLRGSDGRVTAKVVQINGADLAEKFPTAESTAIPGMVMEIDPDASSPGQLRLASKAYSKLVAGVVSGANGLPAGAILGNLPESDDHPAIALSGRVWLYCDGAYGAVTAGDLLTTSRTPGYAMVATDRDAAYGATIGKAMTSLPVGERGLVLVLVNLQ